MCIRALVWGLAFLFVGVAATRGAEPMNRLAAVQLASEWVAAHQLADGGWSFDHRGASGCDGKCAGHGELTARNAASAFGVLTLIAAGQGEKDAKHSARLKAGLGYLVAQLKAKDDGARLTAEEGGGSMYSHGLVTLALCEGLRVTGNEALKAPAQKAIDHICYAQDPAQGGWRYSPRQAGDTSVTGWQVAALVSGKNIMLEVPAEQLAKAQDFFDVVQSDAGARYGYTGPGGGQATTAIGLLCRRRLGWKADEPAFVRGIELLVETGPSKSNTYYNFYATQALRTADDKSWADWRDRLDTALLHKQSKEGHSAGSWSILGNHGSAAGGRLYSTAMAALMLSVEQEKLSIFKK